MTNPNPFVPKGSLLEQSSQRRSRLKLAVFCVLAVSVTGLTAMLIQGCKREKPADENTFNPPSFAVDTNVPPPAVDTNAPPPTVQSNTVSVPPPMPPTPVPPVPPAEPAAPAAGSEYVVVQGDTLGKIAKKTGVTLKALEAANPGVDSKKLKIKQKLVIPAGGNAVSGTTAPATVGAAVADTGSTTYTVKSGDTLTKIAKAHGTTVKVIQAANSLTTTKIKVGDKLKIPSKTEVAPAAPAPAPTPVDTTPAPALPPTPAPVLTPAPAPAK